MKFTHWLSGEAVWERYHTLSQFAVLEGQELAVSPMRLLSNSRDIWLTTVKDMKKKVFEATAGPDVETNENGDIAVHGQTFSAWTTAVPGAPLKNGG